MQDTRQRYLRQISGISFATASDTALGGVELLAFDLPDPRGTTSLFQRGGRERTHAGCYLLRMRGIGKYISQICHRRGNVVATKMCYICLFDEGRIRLAVLCLELVSYLREYTIFPVEEDFVGQAEPKRVQLGSAG